MCFADKHNTPAGSDAHWRACHINGYFGAARQALYERVVWVATEAVAHAVAHEPVSVCDFGCGEGTVLEMLSGAWPDTQLYGVDYSLVAIGMAKNRVRDAQLLAWDICDLDERDGAFEVGLCIQTLEHVKSYDAALNEIMRTVTQLVVMSVPNGPMDQFEGHHNRWTLDEFRQLLSPFGTVHARVSPNQHHIIAVVNR
jgi:2-polyprenyl-3-methyl-5-hydroxy-6-metoxy-1,4-benzoquinol methylase